MVIGMHPLNWQVISFILSWIKKYTLSLHLCSRDNMLKISFVPGVFCELARSRGILPLPIKQQHVGMWNWCHDVTWFLWAENTSNLDDLYVPEGALEVRELRESSQGSTGLGSIEISLLNWETVCSTSTTHLEERGTVYGVPLQHL